MPAREAVRPATRQRARRASERLPSMIIAPPRQSSWRRIWWAHPELSLAAVAAAAWLAVLTLHITAGPFQVAAQHCRSCAGPRYERHHHGTSYPGIAGHQSSCRVPGGAYLPPLGGVMDLDGHRDDAPAALPAARSISLNGKWRRRQRGPALFAFGYLVAWSAVGVLLLSAVWLIGGRKLLAHWLFPGHWPLRRHGSRRAGSDCVCVPAIAYGRCPPMVGERTEHLSARESATGFGARARVVQ